MKRTNLTTNLIACAVIAGAFTAGFLTGPATAQPPEQDVTPFAFKFTYKPSELGSTRKAEAMLVRLENAVRAQCGGARKMSLREQTFVTKCINSTMKTSVTKFGSETVAQAWKMRADG